jgi:predicted Zn finger-like uncharacterized protein
MLLACPNCSSAFRLPATAIASGGRTVRCSTCQHVWTAVPADLQPEPQLEEALVGAAPAMARAETARAEMAMAETAEPPSLTGDSQLDAEIEAAFAAADRSYETLDAEADDIVAIDRPLEPEMMVEADDAPPLAPIEDPFAEEPPAEPPKVEVAADDVRSEALDRRPAPEDEAAPPPVPAVAAMTSEEAETFQELRRKRRPLVEKPSVWMRALHITATVVAMTVAAVFIWRSDLVRLSPNLAGFYDALGLTVNLRGLEFHEVKAVRDVKDGIPLLTVEGYVFNPGPKAADIPKLRMAVLGANGRELYAWTAEPAQTMLAAGESFVLRSRIASPPQDGQDVLVRFLLKRDLVNAKP